MALADRYRDYGGISTPGLPSAVKWLVIVNTAVWLVMFMSARFAPAIFDLFRPLGLVPYSVLNSFAVWQLFTYMFLHDYSGLSHILWNMLTIWWIGSALEAVWGSKLFLKFYLYCGLGAGLCIFLVNYAFGLQNTWTVGASGAIFGILLAFAVLFPDAQMLFFFLIPMKAKYYVMILGAVSLLMTISSSQGGVSHVAHLGGLIAGWIILKHTQLIRRPALRRGKGPSLLAQLEQSYKDWKFQRAKKKFQVYLKKSGSRQPDDYLH
jgi:membrane associated rhomboid family serine protease